MTTPSVPSAALLGGVALAVVQRRVRGCQRPVRLVGSTTRIERATGQVLDRYSSGQELDGITWVRCGDRRAARCESCSREYKG
ncbi:MAG TPA: replication initiator, partial [Acidimicrobiales bacterium]